MRIGTIIVLLLLPCGFAAPVPKAAQADISGTTWRGYDKWSHGMNQEVIISFEKGGKLVYHQDKSVPGHWSQEGRIIRWEINSYSSYEAVIEDKTLQGRGGNKDRQTCTFTFTRVEP